MSDKELAVLEPGSLAERKKEADTQVDIAGYWATKLMDIVEKCSMSTEIGDKKYLEVEGWQVIGEFAGVRPVIEWTRPWISPTGEHIGYEARVLIQDRDGNVVTSGESSCGFDAFPCRGKEGSEKDKAARSAAQTWVISRAYRHKYGYVAKLAGYEAVPAEEMFATKEAEKKVAAVKCPTCHKENTIIKGKPEYGGGWLCYSKKGGCGAKFDYDPANPPSSKVAEPQAKEGAKEKIQFPSQTHEELYNRVHLLCGGDPIKIIEATKTLTSWSDARKNFHEGMGNIFLLSSKQAEEALARFEKEFGQMAL